MPDALMVATAGWLLLNTPPAAASVNAEDDPVHSTAEPDILPALGCGTMVTLYVAETDAQVFATV